MIFPQLHRTQTNALPIVLRFLLSFGLVTVISSILSQPVIVYAAPVNQELPAPLTDYAPLTVTIAGDGSTLELTRVDFWPRTVIFLGTWTTGAGSPCIYRGDFALEIGGGEYKAASRDFVDDDIYRGIETPGSGLFGVCGTNESKSIAIPFNVILSDEPPTFVFGDARVSLPTGLQEIRDSSITPVPTPTPTVTSTSTPTSTPTPTFTPASVTTSTVALDEFSLPASTSARSVARSGQVGNRGIRFSLERIDFWDELPRDAFPVNDVFIVLTGRLEPVDDGSARHCVGGDDVVLWIGEAQYQMDNMRDAQRFYEVDFPGFFSGQCVSKSETEPTFLVFDVKLTSARALLSFHDARLDLGATLSELEAASTVPSLGRASSQDGPVSETSTEDSTLAPPATLLLPTVTSVPPTVISMTETPEPLVTNTSVAPQVLSDTERCLLEVYQQGRSEPQYVGLAGYLKATPSGDDYADLPTYPWRVPLLVQTGPDLWEDGTESLLAKTPVIVVEQHLKHEGYGFYSGYLVVKSLEDSQQYNIEHYDFVPTDYWNCPPHLAIRYSTFVARVKDGISPVDKDGRWQEMGEEREVYCTGLPSIGQDAYVENGVVCLVYKEYRYGYGGVPHIFPSDGLEIVY